MRSSQTQREKDELGSEAACRGNSKNKQAKAAYEAFPV